MNIDGSDQRQLTFPPIREDGPWFSPEGDKIVFRRTTQNGHSNLFIINIDGTGLTNVTNDNIGAMHPTWRNDNFIYFVTHGSDYRIWKIRPNGSELNVVSPFKIGAHARVQFSNDNQFIFFDSSEYPNQIIKATFPSFSDIVYMPIRLSQVTTIYSFECEAPFCHFESYIFSGR